MIYINLNKRVKRKGKIKIEKKGMILFLLLPVVLSLIVIIIIYSSTRSKITSTENEITSYNQRISILLPKVQKVEMLKAKENIILKKINIIKELKAKQAGPVGYLYFLQKAIPRFSWISSLQSSGNLIKLHGDALDGQVVSIFMDKLNDTGFFENIQLIQTTEEKRAGFRLQNFQLTFDVKPPSNAVSNKPQGQ